MGNPGFTTGPVAPASPPGAPINPAPGTVVPISAPGTSPFAAPTPSPSPGPAPTAPTTRLDNPHELNASAGIARQIATDLDSANGKGGNNLAEHASTAATRIRGFSFGGALTASTERWLQQCRTLHDKLTGTAEKLDSTQRNYHGNEHATAAGFGA
ncbi:hypothetical protein [Streptomyces sp. CB01881]|uniref:hypothetical protein n=1 Tax=Streptomyces sp. CB01881 TaxID=2078691 RepID=UPI00129CE7AD|nr:hypothetical protein [Streptomyces sp. CB01881]